MSCTSKVVRMMVLSCLFFMLVFPLFGGGAWGKNLFGMVAENSFLHDKKAGVPILMLTIPLLIAASIAAISPQGTMLLSHQRILRLGCCGIRKKINSSSNAWIAARVLLPCLVYVLASMRRKLSLDMSLDKALMKSGNIFGMVAVIVLSWLLVPVTPKGPIGRFLAWDTIRVVRYHKWGGRLVVLASIVHGTEHTIRYALQGKDVMKAFYLPPVGCWKNPQTYQPEVCDQEEDGEDCSCYDHFLPVTGLAALAGLVLIGITSAYKIRRTNYAFFVTMHYALTPLTFLAICIHYNKAILYASGSLLYYLASNGPSWVERLYPHNQHGVKIVSVERLPSDGDDDSAVVESRRPCVSVTFEATEATEQEWFPGAFLRMSVPSISKVPHPFTVNRVWNGGSHPKLRVIFRATGPFTRALESALCSGTFQTIDTGVSPMLPKGTFADKDEDDHHPYHRNGNLPNLYLDGYYGSGKLLEQIQTHDLCLFVAAGIGITPYLSLVSSFIKESNNRGRTHPNCNGIDDQPVYADSVSQTPKLIVLHWICRDRALIEYCKNEYFEFKDAATGLQQHHNEQVSIQIIIHNTGGDTSENDAAAEKELQNDDHCSLKSRICRIERMQLSRCGEGLPFEPSMLSSVGQSTRNGILRRLSYFGVFCVISWGGLACLWMGFEQQGREAYVQRIYTLVAVVIYGLGIAILVNACSYFCAKRSHTSLVWSKVAIHDGDEEEPGGYGETDSDDHVELSTWNSDSQDASLSPSDSLAVKPNADPPSTMSCLQGRPSLESILQDLDGGLSPALFCCLPENLERTLRDGLHRRATSAGEGTNRIPVYPESFEL